MSNFKSFLINNEAIGYVCDGIIRYTCPICQALAIELGIFVGALGRSIGIVSGGK